MAEASIPVDLFNPGQVFACIGFAEAADVLLGDAQGVFDWSDPSRSVFRLRATGDESPVLRVLRFIDAAKAQALAPAGSAAITSWLNGWGPVPEARHREMGYPFPDPIKPAKLACTLTDGETTLMLDYWGDASSRDAVKFWSGAAGYPGAALARDALELVRGRAANAEADPFSVCGPQSSSFGLDWRRDYIPIDLGFSVNKHDGRIKAIGFPVVELLGAIGLGSARPYRPDWRNKMLYAYSVCGRARADEAIWLPLTFLRVSLGCAQLPFPMRNFKMLLAKPSESSESRSITTVTEENLA